MLTFCIVGAALLLVQPRPDDEAALLRRIDEARPPGGFATFLNDRLIEYDCQLRTFRRLNIDLAKPEDASVGQFTQPKTSRFQLRLARFKEHELIEMIGSDVDPFHTSYPFGQNVSRLTDHSGGLYLDRRRNTMVTEPNPVYLPQFNTLDLPYDLTRRVLSENPGEWLLPDRMERMFKSRDVEIGSVRDGVQVTARNASYDSAGNILVTERFTHRGVLVKGIPIEGLRTIAYAPSYPHLPLMAQLVVDGKISQDWVIEWEQAGETSYLPRLLAANLHMSVNGTDYLMSTNTFRLLESTALTPADVSSVFNVAVPADIIHIARDTAEHQHTGTGPPKAAPAWVLYAVVGIVGAIVVVLIARSARVKAA